MVDYSIFPLEEEIKDKLAKLEISYAFQPIFFPDGKEIYAYEALMRPKNISVTNLIEEFRKKSDLHTLEVATIFGAVQCYGRRGYNSYIAINSFPAESFTAEEQAVFDEFYADVLGDKGIIEILEYTALDIDKWQSKKNSINRSRFNIALDDFGTGNSSLSLALELPFDELKVDMSFIRDIKDKPQNQAMVQSIIDYAKRTKTETCIEGIENREIDDYIRKFGATWHQGYYYSKPVPIESIEKLICK